MVLAEGQHRPSAFLDSLTSPRTATQSHLHRELAPQPGDTAESQMHFDKESLTPAQSHRQSADSGTSQPPGANVPSFCSPGGWAGRRPHHTLGRHGVQGAPGWPPWPAPTPPGHTQRTSAGRHPGLLPGSLEIQPGTGGPRGMCFKPLGLNAPFTFGGSEISTRNRRSVVLL